MEKIIFVSTEYPVEKKGEYLIKKKSSNWRILNSIYSWNNNQWLYNFCLINLLNDIIILIDNMNNIRMIFKNKVLDIGI